MAKTNRTEGKRGEGKPPRKGRGLSAGWTWGLVGVAVIGFGAFVLEPMWRPMTAAQPPREELVQAGAVLYQKNCAACHGAQAQGQEPGQPMGGTRADGTFIAPALNGTAHAWHHPPQMLHRIIKDGSPAPESPMKGWAGRMSDEEIDSVLAYMQSLWPPQLLARYRSMHGQP